MKDSQGCSISTINSSKGKKSKVSTIVKPSLIALAVAQTMSMSSAQAATIYVGGANGAGCGLIEAILSANNDRVSATSNCVAGSGDDVIELNRDVTLTKARQFTARNGNKYDTIYGLPRITSNITVNGNGHTIGRAINATDFGIIGVSGSELILNEVVLDNGAQSSYDDYVFYGMGTAINAHDTNLTLNNTVITNNSGPGAVKANRGSSTKVNNSTFSGNGAGLFIYSGNADISQSTFFDNGTGVLSRSFGSVNISNSLIDSNGIGVHVSTVTPDLPIDFLAGQVSINESSIINNSRGIDLGSVETIEIKNSDISSNAGNSCAGLRVSPRVGYGDYIGGDVTHSVVIDNSTFSDNISETVGGGICFFSNDAVHYSGFYVNGISHPTVMIRDSTFTNNVAGSNGGAIHFEGPTSYDRYGSSPKFVADIPSTIVNSTFYSNSAGLYGGALFLGGSPSYFVGNSGSRELNLINSSIIRNLADNGAGIFTDENEGKVYLNLFNSIIAGNSATVSGSEINHLSALSYPNDDLAESNNNVLGSSLESSFQAFNGFTPSATDITATIDGTNPAQLDDIVSSLQDNGGATQTHALSAGSPAIDAGDLDTCMNDPVNGLDQRGEVRGELGLCDIGAYETQGMTGDLPTINIDSVEVSEGDAKARLTISLSSPQPERILVDFQTVDGTATEGLDYTGRFGTMTFAPGQTQKVRVIQLNDDDLGEQTETFSLMLSNPVGATLDEAVGEVTIIDDDGLPTISIEPADHSVNEGDSGNNRRVSYTIKLSSAQTEKVSVDYQTMDESAVGGVDYEIRSGRMTFAPGQTSKIRTVKVLGDTQVEADETFKLVFSNPSSNAALDIDEADSIGTILNDD